MTTRAITAAFIYPAATPAMVDSNNTILTRMRLDITTAGANLRRAQLRRCMMEAYDRNARRDYMEADLSRKDVRPHLYATALALKRVYRAREVERQRRLRYAKALHAFGAFCRRES